MRKIAIGVIAITWLALATGCSFQKPYGEEEQLFLPGTHRQVWAIAPAINLSGQSQIDPLLQSDLVYQELQKVHGLTVIPVDRVVEVYASLKIDKVQSERQAEEICRLLGCDGLVVPTVTAYDPYDPPKFGASVQLFVRPGTFDWLPKLDPRALERNPTVGTPPAMPQTHNMAQVVEMYDASDGDGAGGGEGVRQGPDRSEQAAGRERNYHEHGSILCLRLPRTAERIAGQSGRSERGINQWPSVKAGPIHHPRRNRLDENAESGQRPASFLLSVRGGAGAQVLNTLVEMVHRRDIPFDWFDAAILSHQLGQHLAKELKAYLPKKVA